MPILVRFLLMYCTISIWKSLSLSQSQGYSDSVTHPCYPADHSRTLTLNSIFNSPCTEKYKPKSYNSEASLTVRGSGHYEHCLSNMSEIFSFDSCPFSRCSFDNVFQPNVTGSFVVSTAGGDGCQRLSVYTGGYRQCE